MTLGQQGSHLENRFGIVPHILYQDKFQMDQRLKYEHKVVKDLGKFFYKHKLGRPTKL